LCQEDVYRFVSEKIFMDISPLPRFVRTYLENIRNPKADAGVDERIEAHEKQEEDAIRQIAVNIDRFLEGLDHGWPSSRLGRQGLA
jgi:hypothetical protein